MREEFSEKADKTPSTPRIIPYTSITVDSPLLVYCKEQAEK
jgi:hypothetical protein